MKGVINIFGVDYKYYTVYKDPNMGYGIEERKALYVKYKCRKDWFYHKIPLVQYSNLYSCFGLGLTEEEFYKKIDMTNEELLILIEKEIIDDLKEKDIHKRIKILKEDRIDKFNKKYN